jgi:hypothetical protein
MLPDARRPGGRAPPVALPLFAGVFALGCTGADETDGRHDVEVRDSAGVEVVRYLDPRVDAVPAELDLRIGVVDGREDEQFHAITGVATDAGGRIFVTDVGANAVRIFDRDGRFVRRIGGPGQGPGEFELISSLTVRGDTVYAFDARRFMGALFDTTGMLLAAFRQVATDGSRFSVLAATPGGWVVRLGSPAGSPDHARLRNGRGRRRVDR